MTSDKLAPLQPVLEKLGFTAENIASRARALLERTSPIPS